MDEIKSHESSSQSPKLVFDAESRQITGGDVLRIDDVHDLLCDPDHMVDRKIHSETHM